LVGKGKAASMAEHVGMGGNLKPCRLAILADGKPQAVLRESAPRRALTSSALVSGFIFSRTINQARMARHSSARSG